MLTVVELSHRILRGEERRPGVTVLALIFTPVYTGSLAGFR